MVLQEAEHSGVLLFQKRVHGIVRSTGYASGPTLQVADVRVPVPEPAAVLCDNQGVVKNASIPESALSKWHNAINYNIVRESVAARVLRVGKEDGATNLADAFTKLLALIHVPQCGMWH